METIFEIASSVSTPLGLAGIFASVFFFSIAQLIKAGIITKTTKRTSGRITVLIINRLFILAFITIFLGFVGFFLRNMAALKTDQANEQVTKEPVEMLQNPLNIFWFCALFSLYSCYGSSILF